MLKQKALRVFVFCVFLWIAVRYFLHGSDRIKSVERAFPQQNSQGEKSGVNGLKSGALHGAHGEKDLGKLQSKLKTEVEEMPKNSKSHAELPNELKRSIDDLQRPIKDLRRIVHLDLKGAAPKVKYLEQIFPLFSSLGASAVLMEYEDMFPYDGNLTLLRSSFAYSVKDIMEIKRLATISNLEIIPLVQTFGHLEFVLKHDKYFDLREVPEFPNSLNPRVPGSLALLKDMLAQVMKLHPEAKHFHIGCDEVYGLGKGQDSKALSQEELGQLYLSHVTAVGMFMTETWPSVKLLIWDDMLRKVSVNALKESGLPKLAAPVVWKYIPELDFKAISGWLSKYQEAGFKHVWFASAFKGASGPDQMWTPFGIHLHNHLSWLDIVWSMSSYPDLTLEGLILTGWQRYEHFSVLCELLPVGIPSLAVCLQTLKYGSYDKAKAEVHHILGCEVKLDKELCYGRGAFAGAELYHLVHRIHIDFQSSVDDLLQDRHLRGAYSRYHRKYSFGNPRNLGLFQQKLTRTLKEWETVMENLHSEMEAIFFPDTIEEWMEENVNEHMDMLRNMVQDVQSISQRKGRPKSQKA